VPTDSGKLVPCLPHALESAREAGVIEVAVSRRAALRAAIIAFACAGAGCTGGEPPAAIVQSDVTWSPATVQVDSTVIESGYYTNLPSFALKGIPAGDVTVAAWLTTASASYFLGSATGPITNAASYRASIFVPLSHLYEADLAHDFVFYVMPPDSDTTYVGQMQYSDRSNDWLPPTVWAWSEWQLDRDKFHAQMLLHIRGLSDPDFEAVLLLREFTFSNGRLEVGRSFETRHLGTVSNSVGSRADVAHLDFDVSLAGLPALAQVLATPSVRRSDGTVIEGNVHFVVPVDGPVSAQLDRARGDLDTIEGELRDRQAVADALGALE
jgi:hypothetical protein